MGVGDCAGYLLPRAPTVLGGPWTCGSCSKTVGVHAIQAVMRDALDQIAARRDGSTDSLLDLGTQLGSTLLHPNHYLIIGIKESIIQRQRCIIRKGNSNDEVHAAAVDLRNRLFREVATVLELVDSKGAGWLEKANKMDKEERRKIQKN